MYNSVEEYFKAEYPDLVKMLGNPGSFWPIVRDNTISNDDLDRNIAVHVIGRLNSSVYLASVVLTFARMTGKLPNPEEVVAVSNQDKLDEARKVKELSPVEEEIAALEGQLMAKVAAAATESVSIEGWGTFYRRDDGWHGRGGFYGRNTPMARMCEEALRAKKENPS